MPKKLGWCERSLAIAQNRKDIDVKSCREEHEVGSCVDCKDYPWPDNIIKDNTVWPHG